MAFECDYQAWRGYIILALYIFVLIIVDLSA
jgi:hypothetical protein